MLRLGHPLTNVSGNTRPYVRASAGELYRTSQKPNFSRDHVLATIAQKLPAISEDEELLSVEEVARRLKVNQKWIYKLIQSGELEATNIGGEGRNIYRISVADFNRLLPSRKVRRDGRDLRICGLSSLVGLNIAESFFDHFYTTYHIQEIVQLLN